MYVSSVEQGLCTKTGTLFVREEEEKKEEDKNKVQGRLMLPTLSSLAWQLKNKCTNKRVQKKARWHIKENT